jgi:hypothetical protein
MRTFGSGGPYDRRRGNNMTDQPTKKDAPPPRLASRVDRLEITLFQFWVNVGHGLGSVFDFPFRRPAISMTALISILLIVMVIGILSTVIK